MTAASTTPPAHRSSKIYRITTRPTPTRKTQDVAPERPSSLYEPSSVQARIQQWQAQGAANALAPDAVSVRSMPLSECPSIVSRPRSEHGDNIKIRIGRRGGEQGQEQQDEQKGKERSQSTPRRRIISDGHWKNQARDKTMESKTTNRQQAEVRRYDPSYISNTENPRHRRRSKKNAPATEEPGFDAPAALEDGIRVTPIQDGNHPSSPPFQGTDSGVDHGLDRHLTAHSVISGDFDTRSNSSIQLKDVDTTSRKPSRYAELLGRHEEAGPVSEAPKTKRGKLLGKTKDMFMKSENVPRLNNRVPSIEAWLEEQPDPFVDRDGSDDLPPVEIPKPLRKRTRRKRSSDVKSIQADPNQIWDSISTNPGPESTRPATPKRDEATSPSAGDTDSRTRQRTPQTAKDHENDGSPSSLRRRGARVHRHREPSWRDAPATDAESPRSSMAPQEDTETQEAPVTAASPIRRPCPPTGSRPLSTIASVETFKEALVLPQSDDPESRPRTELQRKLTTHEDLMSVLSMPRGSRARRSRRATRGSRAKQSSCSAKEVLTGLVADEQKYSRELQTLVDGVIPVLLQCALSKTDSNAAAALFTATASDGMGLAKPIIDIGVALEKLKSLHKRMPHENVEALLNWAKSSEKAYRGYLQAWRLGFDDIVVNLAPIDGSNGIDNSMSRDEVGDLLDGEGKKADVAYLLKRPLVRVKSLSKTFAQIRDQADLPLAVQMADTYADLTALARKRNQEEQARLEDELAANVDATRTRDIRTMAPSTQVQVNKTRRVKARDFFNLTLYHSNGQRLDCGVELVFRDNSQGDAPGGDVLVCEVDDADKWLLFAPVELNCISARRGEDGFDLVLMIRGWGGLGKEWHELLALKTDDKDAVTEWMGMLGSNPLPPRLNRAPDFVHPPAPLAIAAADEPHSPKSRADDQKTARASKHSHADVPIGEPSVLGAPSEGSRRSESSSPRIHRPSPGLNLGGGLASKPHPMYPIPAPAITRRPVPSVVSSDRSTISDRSIRDSSTVFTGSSLSSRTAPTNLSEVSSRPKQPQPPPAAQQPLFPQSVAQRETPTKEASSRDRSKASGKEGSSATDQPREATKRILQQPHESHPRGRSEQPPVEANSDAPSQRPVYHRTSSTPARDLPTVNKIRAPPQQTWRSPSPTRDAQKLQDATAQQVDRSQHPRHERRSSKRSQIYTEDIPPPPAHSQRQHPPSRPSLSTPSSPPPTPPHRSGVLQPISNNKSGQVPALNPVPQEKPLRRRGSSPLKHEYAPSTTSESSSDYESGSDSDSSSDTSEEFVSEHGDMPTPLVAITGGERRTSKPSVLPSMPPSSYQPTGMSTGTRTLAPSDSASQGPYRKVPSSASFPADRKSRTIALICTWSDRGMWEQIHPDECSIVISPGLIEAFEMSAAHSKPLKPQPDGSESSLSSAPQQPLVAFELTPIVPLRRGTVLDISIRSPPTPSSKIRTTNNVMFRSRNPEECEALYGMINWARCNNPTYIQLQAARPHRQPSVTFNVGPTGQGRAKSSSWFSFGSQKKSSYRASSAPTPASIDMSVESTGTISSAFSALKRLGVSNAFNLNRSSVHRKEGRGGGGSSLYSSNSGTRTGSGSSTPAPSQAGFVPGKDGPNVPSTSAAAAEGGGMVNNMKIRLYARKGQHWENLGAARLTILPASPPQSGQTTPRPSGLAPGASPPATPLHSRSSSVQTPPSGAARGPRLPSSSHTPHRVHGNGREKRILITRNKDQNAILLDQVLGESCFERVMQTGIAVKVWSEDDVIADEGGVLLGREKIYMLQFGGAREAGWVFGLVGTYRYGGVSVDG
jgi:hypothetical protein